MHASASSPNHYTQANHCTLALTHHRYCIARVTQITGTSLPIGPTRTRTHDSSSIEKQDTTIAAPKHHQQRTLPTKRTPIIALNVKPLDSPTSQAHYMAWLSPPRVACQFSRPMFLTHPLPTLPASNADMVAAVGWSIRSPLHCSGTSRGPVHLVGVPTRTSAPGHFLVSRLLDGRLLLALEVVKQTAARFGQEVKDYAADHKDCRRGEGQLPARPWRGGRDGAQ